LSLNHADVYAEVMDLASAMPDLWIEEPTSDLKTDFAADPERSDGICEYTVPTGNKNKDIEVVFSYPVEGVRNRDRLRGF
jgi:hypothetical protein